MCALHIVFKLFIDYAQISLNYALSIKFRQCFKNSVFFTQRSLNFLNFRNHTHTHLKNEGILITIEKN